MYNSLGFKVKKWDVSHFREKWFVSRDTRKEYVARDTKARKFLHNFSFFFFCLYYMMPEKSSLFLEGY